MAEVAQALAHTFLGDGCFLAAGSDLKSGKVAPQVVGRDEDVGGDGVDDSHAFSAHDHAPSDQMDATRGGYGLKKALAFPRLLPAGVVVVPTLDTGRPAVEGEMGYQVGVVGEEGFGFRGALDR